MYLIIIKVALDSKDTKVSLISSKGDMGCHRNVLNVTSFMRYM